MFLVMERCDDFEQALVLRIEKCLPPAGLLDWANDNREPRALFPDRRSAREAIVRTEHYRLAFPPGRHWPEKKFCVVVPARVVVMEAP